MSKHKIPEEPLGQLPPLDWMEAAETKAVVAALSAEGAEIRFVGGCVRDSLLKRQIKDVDIATHDPPDRVMALLSKAGIHVIPTGLAHGTVTAIIGKAHFEITTLREDVETFGRHARVTFTDDWTADAARRDFTMNAMFADPQGQVYDPFNGLADLGHGRVRFVGDPIRRIEEDVLRLLRYFRFHANYGRPPMEPRTVQACRQMAPRLTTLSGERVAGELIRLLLAPEPTSVLLVMHGEGILQHILPEAKEFGRLRVLTWLETRALVKDTIHPDPFRRLGALLETDAEGARAVGERLKLSNLQTHRLVALCAPRVTVSAEMTAAETRKALRQCGPEEFRDLVLVAWAAARAVAGRPNAAITARWTTLLDAADAWQPVELPVRGADCLALGLPPGPLIGRALAEIDAWWEAADYRPGRDAALAKLQDVAALLKPPAHP